MDALLINPKPLGRGMNEATIEPPLGIGYMAAVLEQNGFSCGIVDANVLGLEERGVVDAVPEDVGVVGISVNSFTFSAVVLLARLLRKVRPKACIVVGGPLPSSAPETVLDEIECDGLVVGEGEFAFLSVVRNIAAHRQPFYGGIPGVVYRRGSDSLQSMNSERIKDLDALPFPAYHLLPPLREYRTRRRKSPAAAIVTSRGCSFGCSFCSKDVFGRNVTYRSPGNVLDEIEHLVEKYGVRQIDILDDNFAMDKNRLEAIMDGIIAKGRSLAINMQTGIRTELLDVGLLEKMKKAGVFKLAFGVESADENVLSINRKCIDLAKVETTVRAAKRLGFLVYGFFIIGLPGETDEALEKTLSFAERVGFDVANFCIAIPFVGTELYKMVQERGRFMVDTRKGIDSGFYDGKVFFEYEGMTKEDVLRRYKVAYSRFYSPVKKIMMLGSIRSFAELQWLSRAFFSVRSGWTNES